jgi:YVTN family beta-propeller protein
MKINKFTSLTIALSILFISCDNEEIIESGSDYSNGILVSGEGSGAGTGSISFIPQDVSSSTHLIYKAENDTELGTYLQSIAFSDTNAYISVDNQNTITVVDRITFEEVGKINSQLELPRYMEIIGGTGYSTNWGSTASDTDDFIAVIDLNSNSVTKTIPVALGPERIVSKDGKLYVSHKGAHGVNNVVSVIDIATDAVTEIIVEDKPDELVFTQSGDLIVLSEGAVQYDMNWNVIGNTLASISKIDTNTNTVTSTITFANGEHPSLLEIDGTDLYYSLNSGVFKMSVTDTELPTSSFIEAGYINEMSISNNQLYAIVASYTSLSDFNVYSLSNKEMITTLKVGIGASKIYFNE